MQGISVIIPVYNREAYLEEAISSVLIQNYKGPLEIIVSDDGSSDRSVEIANSFGNPVRVVLKPEKCLSQGVSGARNRGIQKSKYPYISFLDSDDYYLPGYLNRVVKKLDDNQELGFAFCRIMQMKEIEDVRIYAPWTKEKITKNDIKYPVISGSNIIHTDIILIRKTVLLEIGGFDESLSNAEDGDLWMRVSEKYKGDFVDYYGAVYRISHLCDQLTSKKNYENIFQCHEKVYRAAYERCKKEKIIDKYRMYRLSMILSVYKKYRLKSIIRLVITHPFMTFVYVVNVIEKKNRNNKLIWKCIPEI